MNILMSYWWIPVSVLWFAISAWLSVKSNTEKILTPEQTNWFWWCFVSQLCPIWAIVSRWTPPEEIVFTAMVYDVVICGTFLITLLLLGCGKYFDNMNWIGVLLVGIGFVLIKT